MRVISGTARGRSLRCPKGRRTRPTPDRVREALFSILAGEVEGAFVLDLFAGTGALGIEALSRGAARAIFVEKDREAADSLRRNLAACGFADRAQIEVADVQTFLDRGIPGGTTLVFLDPPYGGEAGDRTLSALAKHAKSLAGVLVVHEYSPRALPLVPPGMEETDRRRYGDTALLFLRLVPQGG